MNIDVVGIARSWMGTPYVGQASVKGAGADCAGLVRGIWREIFGADPEDLPDHAPDWGEVGGKDAVSELAARYLCPVVADPRAGDILLFRMRRGAAARHFGIMTRAGPTGAFIHAYERHGVIESPLSVPWQRRLAASFRFPGI